MRKVFFVFFEQNRSRLIFLLDLYLCWVQHQI